MSKQLCDLSCTHHEAIECRVDSAERRLGRIEGGILGALLLLIAQLWMIFDLPTRLRSNTPAPSVVSTANALPR